jgi:hypothetical protein
MSKIVKKEIEPDMKGLIKALQDYAKLLKIAYKVKTLKLGYEETYAEKLAKDYAISKTAQKILEIQRRLPDNVNLLDYIKF